MCEILPIRRKTLYSINQSINQSIKLSNACFGLTLSPVEFTSAGGSAPRPGRAVHGGVIPTPPTGGQHEVTPYHGLRPIHRVLNQSSTAYNTSKITIGALWIIHSSVLNIIFDFYNEYVTLSKESEEGIFLNKLRQSQRDCPRIIMIQKLIIYEGYFSIVKVINVRLQLFK